MQTLGHYCRECCSSVLDMSVVQRMRQGYWWGNWVGHWYSAWDSGIVHGIVIVVY